MDRKKLFLNVLWIGSVSLFIFIIVMFFCGRNHYSAIISFENIINKRLIFAKYYIDTPIDRDAKLQNVIYILGGSHHNLEKKFRIAADLYRKNLACKILIMSVPGKTGYYAYLNRNLTNDEWANVELIGLGIRKEDIEMVKVRKGYFGTYSEALDVSDVVSKRNYKGLILVTSRYHTRRAWASFSKLLINHDMKLYIHDSDESIQRRDAVVEFIKLKIYEYILL